MQREITIQLSDETAEALERRAARAGGSLGEIVETLVRQSVGAANLNSTPAPNSGDTSGTATTDQTPATEDDVLSPEEEAKMSFQERMAYIRRLTKGMVFDSDKSDKERIGEYLDEKYG